MDGGVRDILARIATVGDMVAAFEDEDRCRRLLEAMVWPRGRLCPACGHEVAEQELSEFCRERLASYKVPRIWRFVDQFPQTASGKLQKYVLRELYLAEKVP